MDGPPPDLPRQRAGIAPQGRGRYPDHDVLAHAGRWDEATRAVVLARVHAVPPLRFFDAEEAATLRAFCDAVTAQDAEPRIPVLHYVDAKLAHGRGEGYRHAALPADGALWRLLAAGLDEAAGAPFSQAPTPRRHALVGEFAAGELRPVAWSGIDVALAWKVVMRDVLWAFYAHPWAWNEIGFGGPAYPRGYARLGIGRREPGEAPEEFAVDPVTDVVDRGLES